MDRKEMSEDLAIDSALNEYCVVKLPDGQILRIYYIPSQLAGFEVDCIRINRENASGKVLQGPEIPLTVLGNVFQSILSVVSKSAYFKGRADQKLI